jgi:transposase
MVTLKAMLRLAAEAEAQAQKLLIEKLKLTIKRLRHERFGQSSERGALLDQLSHSLSAIGYPIVTLFDRAAGGVDEGKSD